MAETFDITKEQDHISAQKGEQLNSTSVDVCHRLLRHTVESSQYMTIRVIDEYIHSLNKQGGCIVHMHNI